VLADSALHYPFTVTVSAQDGIVTMCLHGELDINSAALLAEHAARAQDSAGQLVLDLTELHFLDCAGARALARAALRPGCPPASLRSPRPPVRRVLQLTGLDQQLTLDG
jgi:anti-anti-sigma factor